MADLVDKMKKMMEGGMASNTLADNLADDVRRAAGLYLEKSVLTSAAFCAPPVPGRRAPLPGVAHYTLR